MTVSDTLTRVYRIFVWLSAVLGLVLLIDTLELVVQLCLAAVLFVTAVLAYTAWTKKAARVVARVLCLLLPVAFLGVMGVYLYFCLQAVQDGAQIPLVSQPTTILALVGTPLLCWTVPGAASVAEKGNAYDGWVARILYTLLLLLVAYCCFGTPNTYMVWHWEPPLLRHLWVIATAVGCVLCWVYTIRRQKEKAEP